MAVRVLNEVFSLHRSRDRDGRRMAAATAAPACAGEAFHEQVILHEETWRAISTQTWETDQLCTTINSAHARALSANHQELSGVLSDSEMQELQLRELAVLDEYERRVHEAREEQVRQRAALCEAVQAARDGLAEDLEASLERTRREQALEEATSPCGGIVGGAGSFVRNLVRVAHRVAVTGVLPVFLAKEAFRLGQQSSVELKNRMAERSERRRRLEEDETIHTLPTIAIPSCGTRDTVLYTERLFKR